MFCSTCGKEIHDDAVVCVHCGCVTKNNETITKSEKTFTATLLFCLFLGGFGAHRFYTGHVGSAIAQMLMCFSFFLAPITGIWVLVDLISILTGNFETKDGVAIKA